MKIKTLSIFLILLLFSSSILQAAHATISSGDVTSQQYQSYQNTQYGFSIDYPKGWNVVERTGAQYAAQTVMISPDNSLQFNAGVFKNKNPYGGLTSTEILGDITSMMRNGCSNSSLQSRGFSCTGPQFSSNATSYHGVPAYAVAMSWTKTFSTGQSIQWNSLWVMIPSGNDLWVLILEGSQNEFAQYQQEISRIGNSFDIASIPQSVSTQDTTSTNIPEQQATSQAIPGWIKNTAKWWSEGSVTDDDFIKALQYLIQNGIIVVPSTQVSSTQNHGMPGWIKNTAKWWSEGQLGDADFIKGIQYMIQNGIIVIQNNNEQTMTNPPGVSTPDFSKPPTLDIPGPVTPGLVTPAIGASKP